MIGKTFVVIKDGIETVMHEDTTEYGCHLDRCLHRLVINQMQLCVDGNPSSDRKYWGEKFDFHSEGNLIEWHYCLKPKKR
ncbi:hypothetical protein KY308_00705 [Candidatus Woesearchaeota archaeon]|nr:hypothetical protein [Candidatus Woesearchaeota archaeon]